MRILVLATSLTLAACASQPDVQSPASATANRPAPVAATAAVQLAAAAGAASVDPTAEFDPPPGYKRRPDMGENVYCSRMVVLGSRFPKQDCRTEQELRELINQRGVMRGEMEQRRAVCAANESQFCGE